MINSKKYFFIEPPLMQAPSSNDQEPRIRFIFGAWVLGFGAS